MTKWVFSQPRSAALAFMAATKADTEPETASARMSQASLAETTSMQYSRFRTDMVSPTLMPAELPSEDRPSRAVAVAVSSWSMDSFPASMASKVSRAVMILVRLAGYSSSCSPLA